MSIATDRREREAQAVRMKILDAARELFAEHGYDAVTMRAIAERVQYTPTAIYYHFRDKDTLIRELVDQDFDELAQAFQQVATIPDPIDRLRALAVAYTDFAFTHPNHYRLMFMTPGAPDCPPDEVRHGNPDRDGYALLKWVVSDAIATGRLRPEYGDASLTSQLCWAAMHGIVSLHIAKGNDGWVDWRPAAETTAAMTDLLIRGLTAATP